MNSVSVVESSLVHLPINMGKLVLRHEYTSLHLNLIHCLNCEVEYGGVYSAIKTIELDTDMELNDLLLQEFSKLLFSLRFHLL